jgi:plastocyanin
MRIAVSLVSAALALGCGSGGTGPARTLTTVDVVPPAETINVSGSGTTVQLAATPKDQDGEEMIGLPLPEWKSADTAIATVSTAGLVSAVSVGGPVEITASITANGVTKTGTSEVVVSGAGAPHPVTATASNTFAPTTLIINAGESVAWTFEARHNVTFDCASDACRQGAPANIPFTDSGTVVRTFPVAGKYVYHCEDAAHGAMQGVVYVQ